MSRAVATIEHAPEYKPLKVSEIRDRKTKWQRESRRKFKEQNGFSTTANYGAGGNRLAVLERDGHACVRCGMTDAEHKDRWSRPITVDHINKDRHDNSLTNLQTLCLRCHGSKDLIPQLRVRKAEKKDAEIARLRSGGHTCQEIAGIVGLSQTSVFNRLRAMGISTKRIRK